MKKQFFLFLSILLFVVSCQKDDSNLSDSEVPQSIELKTKRDVNNRIIKSLDETGEFKWEYFNVDELWDVHKLSNNVSTFYWNYKSENNLSKDIIIKSILSNSNPDVDKRDIVLEINESLKYVILKVDEKEAFKKLFYLNETVIVEPYYEMFSDEELKTAVNELNLVNNNNNKSKEQNTQNKNSTLNYSGVAEPTAFYNHDIPVAWDNGLSGLGIRVAVIDNGIDNNNDTWFKQGGNLNGNNPVNRGLRKYGFHRPWPNWMWWLPANDGKYKLLLDLSGDHGTSMLKNIAAPLGTHTGVAYNADVSSLRSTSFFGLFTAEALFGVAKSFDKLKTSSSTKVISMSQGALFENEAIARAIDACYNNTDPNKQKIIITAGGTFSNPLLNALGYVTFGQVNRTFTLWPGRGVNTLSATGISKILDGGNGDIDNATWCPDCFGRTDFVVEFNSGGSSSVATSMTSGMAALIWSSDLTQTRDEVIEKMKLAAERPENNKHANFGYGRISMSKYLGLYPVETDAPNIVSVRSYLGNKYVSSENGSTNGMTCNRNGVGSWEKFTIVELPDGKVALKGNNDKYVSSENGAGYMKCNRVNIGHWEKFTVYYFTPEIVAFVGTNGKLVSSKNGVMRCNASSLSYDEIFTLTTL